MMMVQQQQQQSPAHGASLARHSPSPSRAGSLLHLHPHAPFPARPDAFAPSSPSPSPSLRPAALGPHAALPRLLTPLPRRLTDDSYFGSRPGSPGALAPSPRAGSPRALPRSPYLSSRALGSPSLRHSRAPSYTAPRWADDDDDEDGDCDDNAGHRSSWSGESVMDDVLTPGDVVGAGLDFQGEVLRRVALPSGTPELSAGAPPPPTHAREFEVERKLGSGSYAVVYLVREVLARAPRPASDDGCAAGGLELELDDDVSNYGRRSSAESAVQYGRPFALKCLSKANLDEEALEAQMVEVTIHQSLPAHPNIVTLHATFETPSFLLLLLEYVPGEDLFYFLEQARDHFDASEPAAASAGAALSPLSCANTGFADALLLAARTPPTPSLLGALSAAQLLSATRLRLVASMFGQMCDAVAHAHQVGVFHRDLKPENFIVTDGRSPAGERRVLVKLTDFGLSTTEEQCGDMDCGSAPYMSYECRNNIAPTYKPRAADVWSLGIVLINMLYHFNPWTDTTEGACSSFSLFRAQPVPFFLQRFTGMTPPVADFFAHRVFCAEDRRASAHEFGAWVRLHLPQLLAPAPGVGHHKRALSTASSTQGFPLSICPTTSRPASRAASRASSAPRTPAMHGRSLSRGRALSNATDNDEDVLAAAHELSTILDQGPELEEEAEAAAEAEADGLLLLSPVPEGAVPAPAEAEEHESESRSQSTTKRRKRGARKGKQAGAAQSVPGSPVGPHASAAAVDATLQTLAHASQTLARELSRQSRTAPGTPLTPDAPGLPPVPALPTDIGVGTQYPPASPVVVHAPAPVRSPVTKKASKWKLSFGKSSGSANVERALASAAAQGAPLVFDLARTDSRARAPKAPAMSATASNVTSLLMGLNAGPGAPADAPAQTTAAPATLFPVDGRPPRRAVAGVTHGVLPPPVPRGRAAATAAAASAYVAAAPPPPPPPSALSAFGSARWEKRGTSPTSVRSVNWQQQPAAAPAPASSAPSSGTASSASSVYSANWRSSMSSAATSSSAFTRFSNTSRQSVSTVATSVSGESWRSAAAAAAAAKPHAAPAPPSKLGPNAAALNRRPPGNVKLMIGVPWELDQLPRGQYPKPEGDIFGQPPSSRKQQQQQRALARSSAVGSVGVGASAGAGVPALEPISEDRLARGGAAGPPVGVRADAATSTTDLAQDGADGAGGPKKVQKGQINALAKMLSAFKKPQASPPPPPAATSAAA